MICPVQGLEAYINVAGSLNIDLHSGYLFRPTCNSLVLDKPLSYEAIYDRLQFYLNKLNINEGETPHSFRGSCAITFRDIAKTANQNSNFATDTLMQHIGWATEWSASHYSRSQRLDQAANMSRAMSVSCDCLPSSTDTNGYFDHQELSKAFTDIPSTFIHNS